MLQKEHTVTAAAPAAAEVVSVAEKARRQAWSAAAVESPSWMQGLDGLGAKLQETAPRPVGSDLKTQQGHGHSHGAGGGG